MKNEAPPATPIPRMPRRLVWFAPWWWKRWQQWTMATGMALLGYVASFDLVRFVLISVGKSDWWYTLFLTVYAPVRFLRHLIGMY